MDVQDLYKDIIVDHNRSPRNFRRIESGIVHRYPDSLLLTPVKVCPVYCRFCFRREQVGSNADAMLSPKELQAAKELQPARQPQAVTRPLTSNISFNAKGMP